MSSKNKKGKNDKKAKKNEAASGNAGTPVKEEPMSDDLLKGDRFRNRFRVEGKIITRSPFHLGSGSITHRAGLLNKEGRVVDINAIATGVNDRPLIPGSSLRGALRNYLLEVFSAGGPRMAHHQDYEELVRSTPELQNQISQIEFMRTQASMLERLFGTPFAEGKIEVWDGECTTANLNVASAIASPDKPPFWDPVRLTYVGKSIAIEPAARVVLEQRLFHYEVVPPGVSFKITLTGQNLTDMELGMLVFGLEAFNSEIWPLTLGADEGTGFGRFTFELSKIYRLKKKELAQWVQSALTNNHAGYHGLEELPAQIALNYIQQAKNILRSTIGGAS
jgi:CRISPR/Cas system CSM-associated protein Csm3 (group 7 of RAMP superfamily)